MRNESEVSFCVKGNACFADGLIKDCDWAISQSNIRVEVMIDVIFGKKSIQL